MQSWNWRAVCMPRYRAHAVVVLAVVVVVVASIGPAAPRLRWWGGLDQGVYLDVGHDVCWQETQTGMFWRKLQLTPPRRVHVSGSGNGLELHEMSKIIVINSDGTRALPRWAVRSVRKLRAADEMHGSVDVWPFGFPYNAITVYEMPAEDDRVAKRASRISVSWRMFALNVLICSGGGFAFLYTLSMARTLRRALVGACLQCGHRRSATQLYCPECGHSH